MTRYVSTMVLIEGDVSQAVAILTEAMEKAAELEGHVATSVSVGEVEDDEDNESKGSK